jgi:5-methylcytosine-specific restriction endonuclease McrA
MFLPEEPKRDKRRAFTRTQKNEIWAQQDGECASANCGHAKLDTRSVEYDHKKSWASRGRTITTNGRALCANCHKIETHKKRLKKVEKRPKKEINPFAINPDFFKLPKQKKRKGEFNLF